MHEYYRIKGAVWSVLEKVGFTIESENNQVDYYGSIRTIFVCNEKRVLLEWDGEEGFGYAEIWKNGGWEMMPTKVPEAKESEFQAAIQKLCIDLRKYL
jgi:hypothetical protein